MTIHSVVIQKLLSTNAHLGRRVAAHHFKIYSCGSRNAMTIIDSDKTLICLRNACNFIGNLVRQKGRFLFVNTNSLFDEIVEQMTKRIGCVNDNSWRLGGFLTNSSSPKKFRSRNKKLHLGSIQPPDCIVIMDTERKSSVILEAEKLQIPVVGFVDSSMPWDTYKRITYPVPANPSVQFVYLFCNLITKTFLYEQKRFAGAMGNAAKQEEVTTQQLTDPKTEIGEEVQHTDQRRTDTANDEIFVLSYESLLPASNDPSETKKLLDKLVVLKLNGGLGTKMGFNGPKSVIEVCNGLTCLDLIANQIESLNFKYGCNIPLLLMNTINTHDGTMKVLEKHSNKNIHTIIQSQHHGVNVKNFTPLSFEGQNSEDEQYPSSHSEVFLSLKKSGKLDVFLSQGKEYFLVLNSDNLADIVDSKILNHLIQNKVEYCMEVIPTSLSDLEESALHPRKEKFQSKEKFTFINTSNLWVKMKAIERLAQRGTVKENYPISKFFDHAINISIPRSRYLPVEATSDLLLLQSDLYTFTEGILTRNTARENPANPSIELGPEFETISDFQSRFKSIPSIIELDSLKVTGNVWFGSGISLKGKVSINARLGMKIVIPDGVVLENKDINVPWDI